MKRKKGKELRDNLTQQVTYEERRQICQMVFSGKTADGRRMGVFITWDGRGKWQYRIEGHLIEASGPMKKDWFVFGGPEQQDTLVTKIEKRCQVTALQSLRHGASRSCESLPPGIARATSTGSTGAR